MTKEREIRAVNGYLMLLINLVLFGGSLWRMIHVIIQMDRAQTFAPVQFFFWIGMLGVAAVFFNGYFTLQPNKACVLILFGSYRGAVRTSGFHWTNPLNTKSKISLRSRNLNTEKLKVNDKRGDPIEHESEPCLLRDLHRFGETNDRQPHRARDFDPKEGFTIPVNLGTRLSRHGIRDR